MRVRLLVRGVVQGVGFRPFIYRIASTRGLRGYVRNLGDASVEIIVQGSVSHIEAFIKDLKVKKPPLAYIEDIKLEELGDEHTLNDFRIVESSEEKTSASSMIPPDIAICDECVIELMTPHDRRFKYFFITCTNCGPRFTIITKLPYDRINTAMRDFPMCRKCSTEYSNPSDRRFHAQTIACKECGPKVFLMDKNGVIINDEDPIPHASELLEDGMVVAIKGIGGFHIAASSLNSEPLMRLRKYKNRPTKPLAIMAKDIKSVKTFAIVGKEEEEILLSYMRPIVLLKKSHDFYLSPLISPGLNTIGVMLPYSGIHILLFDCLKRENALVMTSANLSGEPIITDNEEAVRKLRGICDYFLVHNRDIISKCDDSVVRITAGKPTLVRRSRGYVPLPIELVHRSTKMVLALGAHLNVTSCILCDNKAFISQHIGDMESLDNYEFLKSSTMHLLSLINVVPEVISCDLHPTMITTVLANKLREKYGIPLIQVQHHYAHIMSLLAESGLEECIGIACDGVGYGDDGKVWGGEVLLCNMEGYKRLGHLMYLPMPGGDLATFYPLRMVAGALYDEPSIEDYLTSNAHYFPGGVDEVSFLFEQLRKKRYNVTSSTGRVFDAVSALLGICYQRSYEGEPAMKLEAVAIRGEDVVDLEPVIKDNVLDTKHLLRMIYEERSKHRLSDLAFTAHKYIARGLAIIAVQEAESRGIKYVGVSGGVAYNEIFTKIIKREVESHGLRFISHEKVPPGDGGISLGQAYAAMFLAE